MDIDTTRSMGGHWWRGDDSVPSVQGRGESWAGMKYWGQMAWTHLKDGILVAKGSGMVWTWRFDGTGCPQPPKIPWCYEEWNLLRFPKKKVGHWVFACISSSCSSLAYLLYWLTPSGPLRLSSEITSSRKSFLNSLICLSVPILLVLISNLAGIIPYHHRLLSFSPLDHNFLDESRDCIFASLAEYMAYIWLNYMKLSFTKWIWSSL